ncbi:MAG: adenylate/guanylate cyclase domain-containing protein [Pirellula sp.]
MPEPTALKAQLGIYENHRQIASFEIGRVTEVGRRQVNEPAPYVKIALPNGDRIVAADITETQVSRKHLTIELLADDKVLLGNESTKNSLPLLGNLRLNPGERKTLELPIACEIGNRIVRVSALPKEDLQLHTLQAAACAPGQSASRVRSRPLSASNLAGFRNNNVDESFLFEWLQAAMDVFHSAASSIDFLSKAARSAIDLVGLDSATILLHTRGEWNIAARETRNPELVSSQWHASQTMLHRVLDQKRTFFHSPSQDPAVAASLIHVQSIVAAPFLDRSGEVLGVLYGERRSGSDNPSQVPIRELDAKLVELLAYGVASGLARIEQERLLIAERVRFEQFFTPELARMLEARGDEMLAARDAEITVLFCDIKGFSRISAANGAAVAIEWVCDVLSDLSDCVADHQGVLVDYAGDALEALWGAPLQTADHATMACRTAMRMRQTLPDINRRWQSRLNEETDISIGIHSGSAKVGNIGSRRKYKYGALGTTVNLASRIQGATKFVGSSMLASGATIAQADPSFFKRRLCSIRTVNIDEPVEIYELSDVPTPKWLELKQGYEAALRCFESRDLRTAQLTVQGLLANHADDVPCHRLLDRVTKASASESNFDTVWTLDGK